MNPKRRYIAAILASALLVLPAAGPAAQALEPLLAGGVAINASTFPDSAFRSWLLDGRNLSGAGADSLLTADELAAIQSLDLSGLGIIKACDEKQIPCIGVDDWQGDKGEMVFWNTIKAMDNMVYTVANMWYDGEDLPAQMAFNMASGNIPYDERDLENLPDELREEVLALCDGILDGSVDVFAGGYEEYDLGY